MLGEAYISLTTRYTFSSAITSTRNFTSESRAIQPLRSHLEHLKRHLPQEYRRLMQAYYMGAPGEGMSKGLRRETVSDAPIPSQSSALDADPKPSGSCSSVCKN